jgi:hypothetical protein
MARIQALVVRMATENRAWCLDIEQAPGYFEEAIARHDAMAMLPILFRRFCASSPRWPVVAKILGGHPNPAIDRHRKSRH